MEEFLKQNYFVLTYSVEGLAAVIGLFCLKKYKHTAVKYFICFLVYSFCIDLLGRYPTYLKSFGYFQYIDGTIFEKNYWWYALFGITSMCFYFYYFFAILNNKLFKKVFRYVSIFLIVLSVLHFIIHIDQFYNKNSSFIRINTSVLIIFGVILYLVEVLQTEKILLFFKSINFYISSVLLIWLLITTPLTFYEIYFSTADWNFVFLKGHIYLSANMFMYLMFTFALLWCNPEND